MENKQITDIMGIIDSGLVPDVTVTPDHQAVLEADVREQLQESIDLGWYTPEQADEYLIEYRKRFFHEP